MMRVAGARAGSSRPRGERRSEGGAQRDEKRTGSIIIFKKLKELAMSADEFPNPYLIDNKGTHF